MLVSALIYLFAAVLSVPIAKRLGLGSVLGYLIAGVLIGPFVFHLVGDQTEVMHFAEFGVVMMLFLVGLELRPSRLWQMRRPILGLGGLQVVLTAAMISALIMLASDFVWQVSLAIGLTLALSSTAIVLQSLTERGLLKTQAGANSFSVLLFQDIAVIPILALLPLLAVGEVINNADVHDSLISHLPVWIQVVITSATILAIVLGGKYLAAPFFRFIAETRMREVFTAFALLIVVAITVLMQAIGLSPALGSFLAGVVLADNEFRHELEVDIEPFKGLLLGLFFITVGASIDFQLLFDQPLFIGLSVVALIAVKILVLAGIAGISNMTRSQGMLFTLALAQGGEFAFVLASSARQFNVFDDALVNMITVVVALSMLISPLLLVAYELYFSRKGQQAQPEPDTNIESTEHVILAGYGRFGQIIGRLLMAQGYNLTILDHSPGQVDLVRRFGTKVYYGDAARRDLLEAAGANEAKLLVIAVDEADKTLDIIHMAKQHFPHLKILARAIDRSHAYAIMQTKIDGLRRETFDSALHLGVDALQILGVTQEDAQHAGKLFAQHDEENMRKLAEVWGDDKQYGIAVQKGLQELKQVLKEDAKERAKQAKHEH
ncbi:monovalent cation:proton antiporter-2 (CPA2) family protein [Bermanella sp. WJH001]|uniref:monovalent cation:proton antiporter-2 (CPA2) family protein n=1 Tax=Bermanella sp. WJH001 TaxID=3048005 RepID=UPI0024BE99C1|nr:monovalent cation:proton antiporter-2 (CPA2) family protein [Bermanella sp. WJH001]MDJ1539260.1 monovalent cation:proton antiporter-2 (CPA2) family protein [Bermanella sp. WJH001]